MALKQIVVELIGDTRGLMGGMKRAEGGVDRVMRSFRRLAGTIGTYLGARALFRQFKGTLLDAEHILDTARAVGVTADEFERLSFVIEKRLGASAGTTEMMFKGLQQRLGKGGKEVRKALGAAGLNEKDLKGMSSADQALAVITALSGIESATQRAAIASTLLGRGVAFQIQKVATAGSAAIQDANDDFTRIGSALSKSGAADAVGNITDEADNLTRAWQVMKQEVVLRAAPGITEALIRINDSGALKEMADGIVKVVEAIEKLINKALELKSTLPQTKFAEALGGLGGVTFDDGTTPQQRAEAAKVRYEMAYRTRPGLLQPMSQAQTDYYFTQHNSINVRDGDQAKATMSLLEREKRMGLR